MSIYPDAPVATAAHGKANGRVDMSTNLCNKFLCSEYYHARACRAIPGSSVSGNKWTIMDKFLQASSSGLLRLVEAAIIQGGGGFRSFSQLKAHKS